MLCPLQELLFFKRLFWFGGGGGGCFVFLLYNLRIFHIYNYFFAVKAGYF